MTLPDSSAMAAMSKAIQRAADASAIAASAPASTRPSPSAVFSPIDQTRCVDAISVVRSGVTRPRWTERAASISSEARTMSTSPGIGISASTGSAAAASASARGNSST